MAASIAKGDVQVGLALPTLTIEVTARTVVMGASASRDWQPQHHDHAHAMAAQGNDIFLNTPNQAGFIQRYLTDWTGPQGRLGKLRFRMGRSICVGHTLTFDATVTALATDDTGCCWADLSVVLKADGEVATTALARIAIPADDGDNPWAREGDAWQPSALGDVTPPTS